MVKKGDGVKGGMVGSIVISASWEIYLLGYEKISHTIHIFYIHSCNSLPTIIDGEIGDLTSKMLIYYDLHKTTKPCSMYIIKCFKIKKNLF